MACSVIRKKLINYNFYQPRNLVNSLIIQRSPLGMKMDTPVKPGYDGPDALFSIAECCNMLFFDRNYRISPGNYLGKIAHKFVTVKRVKQRKDVVDLERRV
jgi:hypothetical protein